MLTNNELFKKGGFGFFLVAFLVCTIGIIVVNDTFDTAASTTSSIETISEFVSTPSGITYNLNSTPTSITSAVTHNYFIDWNGVDSILQFPDNNSYDLNANITFSAWVYLKNDTSRFSTTSLIDKVLGTNGGYHLFWTNSSKRMGVQVSNWSGAFLTVTESSPTPLNEWVLYTGHWNNETKNLTLYRAGTPDASSVSAAFNNVGNNTQPLNIGAAGNNVAGNWSIDSIRIYNRSLSNEEIMAINSSGRVSNGSLPNDQMVFWVEMNEGTGTGVHNLAPVNDQNILFTALEWKNDSADINLIEGNNFEVEGNLLNITDTSFGWSLTLFVYQTSSLAPILDGDTSAMVRVIGLIVIISIIVFLATYIILMNRRVR